MYRRYSNRLAAYGSHLLGDAVSGDDVAQATMLKAYTALRAGRVPERVKPWLFRIAHNTAIDLVVRRRESPSDELPDAPSGDREPFAGALVEALAALPDRQRRVYVLREVHGLRIDETAAELGLTASQVEQSLFAARNRLAEQLVFGDRLNCVTVLRLAAGPLDAPERRALKTHLRTCHECRQTLGLRGRALALFPSASGLEWLRGLGAGLLSGGAPAAAKVGALVATATIAAGAPVAVEQTMHRHAQPSLLQLGEATVGAQRAQLQASAGVLVVARSTAVAHEATSHGDFRARDERHDGSTEPDSTNGSGEAGSKAGTSGDGSSRDSHSGDGSSSGGDSSDRVPRGGDSSTGSSGTPGSSTDSGRSGSESDTSHGGSSTTESSTSGSKTKSDSSTSGDGSTSGSDDHSDGSTTTTTVPLAPPLLTVTVPSGD